jgi:hypothetical protein
MWPGVLRGVTSLEGTVQVEGRSCLEAEQRGQGRYLVNRGGPFVTARARRLGHSEGTAGKDRPLPGRRCGDASSADGRGLSS